MTKNKIALSGAQGFVGSLLTQELQSLGYEIWPLVRSKSLEPQEIYYDYKNNFIEKDKLDQCDAVIHLAGKNIKGLWTRQFKRELYESRVVSTKLIAQALSNSKCSVFICASAAGYYGDGKKDILDEKSPRGIGFLPELCEAWEQASNYAASDNRRVINLRFGLILSREAGILKSMEKIFKLGLGAIMGSGKQYMAVVSREDAVRAILFALSHKNLKGPLNITCAQEITNERFSKILARALKQKIRFRVPEFLLKLMGDESSLMLNSCRAVPQALLDAGFKFTSLSAQDIIKKLYYAQK